jgi:aryl-alcohol dehydrogenase-like predicted oxidoreductase
MQYRRLGNSGLEVSVVGLGTNNFGGRTDVEASVQVVKEAVEQGINLLDTADVYGGGDGHRSEEIIGQALKGIRSQVLLATKVGSRLGEGPNTVGASRHRIIEGVEASLRALDTDYIDLYQIHQPDRETPIEETLRALDDLVRAGKVRYIGCSNYMAWEVVEALGTSGVEHLAPFISVQPEFSMLVRDVEEELVPLCRKYNLGILPYFPLAGGFLTGKYRRGQEAPDGTRLANTRNQFRRYLSDDSFDLLERLDGFATARSHSLVDLAFAWLLTNPQVSSVIAGATRPEQVQANAKAGDWTLTAEEKEEVDKILAGSA